MHGKVTLTYRNLTEFGLEVVLYIPILTKMTYCTNSCPYFTTVRDGEKCKMYFVRFVYSIFEYPRQILLFSSTFLFQMAWQREWKRYKETQMSRELRTIPGIESVIIINSQKKEFQHRTVIQVICSEWFRKGLPKFIATLIICSWASPVNMGTIQKVLGVMAVQMQDEMY